MGKSTLSAVIITFFIITIAFIPSITGSDEEEEEVPQVNRIAILETDFGIIKFELYENWTPITSSNFIDLAESGHYEGVLFHRIVDDFVIQTGDGGGSSTIPLEIHPNATHIDGAVGMARSEDPDSAEDQFYICDGAQHGLDGDYAVFGIVIEGIEVVRDIAQVPVVGENGRERELLPTIWRDVGMPKEDVFLNKVTIEIPEVNETTAGFGSRSISSGIPLWALGFVLVVGAVVLLIYLRSKKWPKNV